MDFYFSLHFDLWVAVGWSKFGKVYLGPGSFEKMTDLLWGGRGEADLPLCFASYIFGLP